MKISVIIAAAGSASRFISSKESLPGPFSKQFVLLNGKSLLFYSLEKFLNLTNVIEIIIVTNDMDSTNKLLEKLNYSGNIKIKVIEGDKLRQDSVYNGFCKVDNSSNLVIIHDVARPLFKIDDLKKCVETALVYGAAILGVPVVDTIKLAKSDKDRLLVKNTLDRTNLFLVQTPQVFSYGLLSRVYKTFRSSNSKQAVTDEASMIEILGEPVNLILGDRKNIKITYPEDLDIAQAIIDKSFSLSGTI